MHAKFEHSAVFEIYKNNNITFVVFVGQFDPHRQPFKSNSTDTK